MQDEQSGSSPIAPGSIESENGFDFEEWAWLQRELTSELIKSSDTCLDLRQGRQPQSRRLAAGLRTVLANDLLLHLDRSRPESFFGVEGVIGRLARRLGSLSAELEVLKAGLVKHRRFVFEDGQSLSGFVVTDVSPPTFRPRRKDATVALGIMTMGRGWHPAIQRPSGRMGRWSGPYGRSTALLPNIGAGNVRVEWQFDVIRQAQAQTVAACFNGRPVTELQLTDLGKYRWQAAFTATIEPHERSSFCFLQISVGDLQRLQLKAQEQPVMAGICVESISILPVGQL